MSSVELRVRAEIVRVVRNVQAADTEFQSHPFVQHESSVLARGYYVIVWSGNLDDTRFNESARFYGPYDLALMAKLKIGEHVAAHQGFDSSPKINQPSYQAYRDCSQ